VRAVAVEVGLGEDLAPVVFVHDEGPVENLTAYAADPSFRDRVHARRLRWGECCLDAFGAEKLMFTV
jgi:hypothetical protein